MNQFPLAEYVRAKRFGVGFGQLQANIFEGAAMRLQGFIDKEDQPTEAGEAALQEALKDPENQRIYNLLMRNVET